MYKEPADLMEYVVLTLFFVLVIFVICVIFLSDKKIKGSLYLNKDGKSDFVCDGVIYFKDQGEMY